MKSSLRSPIHITWRPRRRAAHSTSSQFRIENVLHPEAAADIGNADAKFFTGDTENRAGEQVADAVRAGGGGYQVQTAARGVELAERTTGFQRSCDNAVVHQLAFHDMRGAADRGFHRADLAAVELERDVVMSLRPDRRGTGQNGICDRDHRRQRLIVNGDSFGGIARAFPALSATTKAIGSPT